MFTLFIFHTCSGVLRCLWKIGILLEDRNFVILSFRILIRSDFSEVSQGRHCIADITKKCFVGFVTKFGKVKWIWLKI